MMSAKDVFIILLTNNKYSVKLYDIAGRCNGCTLIMLS